MIAVIFEVLAASGRTGDYLRLVEALRVELDQIDGFISVERFESLTAPGKILSLSFWRDDTAVANWRNRLSHRTAQASGRAYIFADYRLRVAEVRRDYGMTDRNETPRDSQSAHEIVVPDLSYLACHPSPDSQR